MARYVVIVETDLAVLEGKVNRGLGSGYAPIGGLLFTNAKYHQALLRAEHWKAEAPPDFESP